MQGFSKAIVSSGSHKIPYRQFEVMKSILGGTPNVEQVPLDIDSILDDNNNFNEDSSHNDEEESGVNDNGNATISSLSHTTTNDSDRKVNDK